MRRLIIPPIALNFPTGADGFIAYGRHKIQCFTGNKDLPTPTPPVQQVGTDFDALEEAEGHAKNKEPGAVALREQLRGTCVGDMKQWATYAHACAVANPARGRQILQSSGFDEKKPNPYRKGDFEVTFPGPGIAHVYVRQVKRGASFEWMISLDGGVTFTSAGTTNVADQIFTGLKKGTDYQVKWRWTIGRTTTEWTQAYHFTQET
jgi:hypothetical protein